MAAYTKNQITVSLGESCVVSAGCRALCDKSDTAAGQSPQAGLFLKVSVQLNKMKNQKGFINVQEHLKRKIVTLKQYLFYLCIDHYSDKVVFLLVTWVV